MAARQNARPRWRTYRTSRISVIELHSRHAEAVDVGCFVEPTPVTAQVGPAKIVNKEEKKVHWLFRFGRGSRASLQPLDSCRIPTPNLPVTRRVEMDNVPFVFQTIRTHKRGCRDLFRKRTMRLIHLFFRGVPGSFVKLSHLAYNKRHERGIQFFSQTLDQRVKLLFVHLGESWLAIRLALVPKDAF